jgi:hypothetical protein
MKNLIRKVLKEITETESLNWRLPKKLVDQLGIKLYEKSDRAYIIEIHFDTRNVIVELFTEFNGEYESYWIAPQVPGSIKGVYSFPIDELPKDVKNFIVRRLDFKYIEYL